MSIIVVDCQTTGLSVHQHQLLGIAMIRCSSEFEVMDSIKLNILYENYFVSPMALAKNRVDLRDYSGFVTESDARRAIFKFLGAPEDFDRDTKAKHPRHTLAGLNVNLDMPFIEKFLTPKASKALFRYRPFDALGIYDILYRIGVVEEAKSGAILDLCDSLGVDTEADMPLKKDPMHDAELARRACREINRLADRLAVLVTKHGYSIKGLLKSNKSVAKTKNKDLQEARNKIKEDDDDEE